jgi:hypothetical protein
MKAFLMHRDQDFDLKAPRPPQAADLAQDLGLPALAGAMAKGDKFLLEVADKVLLRSSRDLDEIAYRQDILKDAVQFPELLRTAYVLTEEAMAGERKVWRTRVNHPSLVLGDAIQLMDVVVVALKGLRGLADAHGDRVRSEGLRRLFAMLRAELDDAYFAGINQHLKTMRSPGRIMIAAGLDEGNKGRGYRLCTPRLQQAGWFRRIFPRRSGEFAFTLDPRDENGTKALAELKDRGLDVVAKALAQSADHIFSFLVMLRTELAFYVGALNLYDRLRQLGAPVAFPLPVPCHERRQDLRGAYDLGLVLDQGRKAVGNDVRMEGVGLVVITGANQGGKSAFLRALGQIQLMMQCGLFVPAEACTGHLCQGLFSHFKREEDASMTSGKFAEELERMSRIVDWLEPGAMILFNESFAATNEREGSAIARQVVEALVAKGIKVAYVTHLYEFAHGIHQQSGIPALFLRAERPVDGRRTYKLEVGEPLPTSFGMDLFRRMFEPEPVAGPGES